MSFLSALGSLVSNITNGVAQLDLHPLLHNAASELLEGLAALVAIDVAWYGAVGDGVTDDTAAFQAALDAASTAWFGKWVYAKATATGYLLAGQWVIPPYVTLLGSHAFLSHRGGRSFAQTTAQQHPGTVLIMGYASAGLDSDASADAWGTVQRGAGLVGFILSDPANAADATPTPKPWAVVCVAGSTSPGNSGPTVRNVYLDCIYRGVKIDGSDKGVCDNLCGYPLKTGLQMDSVADVWHWQNVRFYPAATRQWNAGGVLGVLDQWVLANGTSFRIGRVDGLDAHGIFSFGYGTGIEFFRGTGGDPFGQITDLEIDGARRGLVANGVGLTGFRILGGSIWANHAPDALPVTFDLPSGVGNSTNGWLSLVNVSLKGYTADEPATGKAKSTALVLVPDTCGTGRLTISDGLFYQWGDDETDAAIRVESTQATVEVDGQFLQVTGYALDVSRLCAADTNLIKVGSLSSRATPQDGIKWAPTFNTTLTNAIVAPGQQVVTLGSTAGLAVGQRLAFVGLVATFTTTAISATGSRSVTLLDPTGAAVGQLLVFDSGDNEETVLVTARVGSVVTAVFTKTHAASVSVASGIAEAVTVEAISGSTITGTFANIHDAGSPVSTGRKPIADTWIDGDVMGRIERRVNIWDTTSGALLHMKGPGATTPSLWFRVTSNGTLQALNHKATQVLWSLVQDGTMNVPVGVLHAKAGLSVGLAGDGSTNNPTLSKLYAATSTSWTPGTVADKASATRVVTVTGVALGDKVLASFSLALPAGVLLVGQVTNADEVTVTLGNLSGGSVTVGAGTLGVLGLR